MVNASTLRLMEIKIAEPTRPDKKLMAVANGKTVHFGQKGLATIRSARMLLERMHTLPGMP